MGFWAVPNVAPAQVDKSLYPREPFEEECTILKKYKIRTATVIRGHRDTYVHEGTTEEYNLVFASLVGYKNEWSTWWIPHERPVNAIEMDYRLFHVVVRRMSIEDYLRGNMPYEKWFVFSQNTGRIWMIPTFLIGDFVNDIEGALYIAAGDVYPVYDIERSPDTRFLGIQSDTGRGYIGYSDVGAIKPDPDMSEYQEMWLV